MRIPSFQSSPFYKDDEFLKLLAVQMRRDEKCRVYFNGIAVAG